MTWLPDQEWSPHPSALDGEVLSPAPPGKPPATPASAPCPGPGGSRLPVITAPLLSSDCASQLEPKQRALRPQAREPVSLPRPLQGPSSSSSTRNVGESEPLPEGQGPWPTLAPSAPLPGSGASASPPLSGGLAPADPALPTGSAELVEPPSPQTPRHISKQHRLYPWLRPDWATHCSLDPKSSASAGSAARRVFPVSDHFSPNHP